MSPWSDYFHGRTLAEEFIWKTVVFIPKSGEDFRGIGLVKFLWKTVT